MVTWYAGAVSLIGALAIVVVAWLVATRRPSVAVDKVGPLIYRIRRGYFIALVVALAGTLAASLPQMPYARAEREPPAMTVRVDGVMWAWMVKVQDPPQTVGTLEVPVGRPVRFDVGSLDVNHGFAVYSPDGAIMGQTQAMPGYRNVLVLTFPAPGTYRVLCLEYCGVAHQRMFSSIVAK